MSRSNCDIFLQEGKQSLRFDCELEIALFKEVININPYTCDGQEANDLWKQVGENTCLATGLEAEISSRTARDKVDRQLKYFKSENTKLLKK